jgi:uncharacterized protein YndB with AHSA1/START domain
MTDTSADTGLEFTYSRDFDAPRELMFKVFMEPEHFVKFWGPHGVHTPLDSVVIEPRVGGRFESTMVADDGSGAFPVHAHFVAHQPPESFTFRIDASGVESTTTFEDLGEGRTRMTIHQTNLTPEFVTEESQAGFATSIDRYEAYLATLV